MTGSRTLHAIIADDEPLARQALRRFLGADPDVRLLAEADDVPSLCAMLAQYTPDVLFLDITMPGGSGMDALSLLTPRTTVVFTTAHAEFAATAFDLDAADYLVKPFGQDRVHEALARVRRHRAPPDLPAAAPLRVLLVRSGLRFHPVPVSDIWRIEGCDDYARIVTAGKAWLHGTTLGALVAQLDPATFLRVHRSHLVNLAHITRLVPVDERRLAAEFPDRSRVVCSRAGSTALRQRARTSES